MTDLQIIAEIVTKYRTKDINILEPGTKHKSNGKKYNEAFLGLPLGISPDYKKDGKRAEKPTDDYLGYKRGSDAFRQFVSRFTERLLNMLFHLDISNSHLSIARKAEFQCSRMQHQVRALSMLYGRRPAVKIAHKSLNLALKYGLSEFVMYNAAYLRTVASESGDKLLFEECSALYRHWMARLAAEEKAKTLLETIIVEYGKSAAQKTELAKVALGYAKEIEKDILTYDSYILQYHKRKLEALGHEIGHHFQKSVDVWNEFKEYLDGHPNFASNIRYGEIALQQLENYLHLRLYNEGNKCAEACEKYFVQGTRDFFVSKEYHYLLAMQSGEYTKGAQILENVLKQRRIEDMSTAMREKWTLFQAYSVYVSGSRKQIEAFNLAKFTNELDLLSKDKRGYNIAILILLWCMLLRKGDFDGLYALSPKLKEYRLRNLRNKQDMRTNLFLGLMQFAERWFYNASIMEKKGNWRLQNLLNASYRYTGNMEGIEIILFEKLWLSAIEDIKKGRRSIKSL